MKPVLLSDVEVLQRFGISAPPGRRVYSAKCPAHDDRMASLSIGLSPDRWVKCHTGCSWADILRSVQIEPSLFKTKSEDAGSWPRQQSGLPFSCAYWIYDVDGKEVAAHVRYQKGDKKTLRWWKNGKSHLDGFPVEQLPLYGAHLLHAFDRKRPVFVTEGEKDCDALLELGLQAVATVCGASTCPSKESLAPLRGFEVRLWRDNDKPGLEHMEKVARTLESLGASARHLSVPPEIADFPKTGAFDYVSVLRREEFTPEALKARIEALPLDTQEPEVVETHLGIRCFADVQPERVEWLWQNRIPKGKITLIDGNPGEGKSTLTVKLAADLSTGRAFPGDIERPPGNVVFLTAEDSAADTIRPRLDAAGADMSRVFILEYIGKGDSERSPAFPDNLRELERTIKKTNAALVVVDPFMAFLGSQIDSHKDQDVRRAMGGLTRVAQSTGAAIVIVRHMNKTRGGPALYRGSGSIGIVGAARCALLVAKDPDDKSEQGLRILAPLKSNLGPPAPALRFQVVGATNGSSMILWLDETTHKADVLLSDPLPPDEQSAVDEGADVLRQILAGGPVESVKVKEEARKAGISERTLWRAKSRVGVSCDKRGTNWYWSLSGTGRVGTLETKTDTYNSAKGEDAFGRVGRLEPEVQEGNSAKPSTLPTLPLPLEGVGRVVSSQNYWNAANSANSAKPVLERGFYRPDRIQALGLAMETRPVSVGASEEGKRQVELVAEFLMKNGVPSQGAQKYAAGVWQDVDVLESHASRGTVTP